MATSNSKKPATGTLPLRAVEEGSAQPLATSGQDVVLRSARRVRVGAASRDAAGAAARFDVRPDDAVCVEYENGIKLWMRADDLLRERGRPAATRGNEAPAWEIDTAPRISSVRGEAGVDRGIVGLGIKVLEFFGIDVAAKSARVIGDKFELKQLKLPDGSTPGLFRVSLGAAPALARIADGAGPKTVAAGAPVLVFLHGTMSSLAGSFAQIWSAGHDEGAQAAAALRGAMQRRYGREVYAFEHRTLTHSPIRNALELARELPVGAQLHLVSHSRGGLVGELMCLGGRNKADDPLRGELLGQLFAADRTVAEQLGLGELDGEEAKARDETYAEDRKLLAELVKTLDERRIQVQRFVRVACPARGTTLASGRLDRWLSVINFLTGDGLIGGTADFLLAVIKQRTDPRTLPGIEAMMPGSALTRLLHLPQLTTTADLSVICGDVQGKGLFGQLKILALDWFYGSDHDLVVNTGSMLGGIARAGGAARFRRDEGEQVNHFRYFTNRKSIDWLADALAREDGSDAGFTSLAEAPHEEPRWRSAVRASRSVTTPRPIVVVVPGTMGSALAARDRAVWLEYFALLKGGLGDIAIDQADVRPTDLLDDFYGPLIEHLTRTHRVEIFPYDWRRSVREAAQLLATRLEGLLPEAERTHQPVHIVAHSMGGLVARAMIADGGAGTHAWSRVSALPGSRLLMLGTPNLGSHEAVRWLTGTNPTEAKLALLDFTRGTHGVIDIVRRYPGLAELLPFDDERSPWGQLSTWKQLKSELGAGFPLVEDAVLRQAGATWKLLRAAPPDASRMIYVAGCQPATVIDHEVVDEEFAGNWTARRQLRFIATREGDGTVSWASGRLAEVPMYYAPDTGHDELCSNADDRRIFRGYVDLLLTGKTDQLPTTPPVHARAPGEPERFVLPPLPVTDDLPDAAAVRSLGFGGGRVRRRAAVVAVRSTTLRVSIRHGDLRFARFPVLVGHYDGDTIAGTEALLDLQLAAEHSGGPLRRARDLGLYPGPAGTHAVYFHDDPRQDSAACLVIGLGPFGELTPARVEASTRDALLTYAMRSLEHSSRKFLREATPSVRVAANVCCLLVGSAGATGLQIRESIESILRGAMAANRRLAQVRVDHKVGIDHVEFIEVFEDVVMQAAYELAQLLDRGSDWKSVDWPERVVLTGLGAYAARGIGVDSTWWQRIDVAEDKKAEVLRFVVTTGRARAEETLASGQLRLVDNLVSMACAKTDSAPELSKTLFEMLLPQRIKEAAPNLRSTLLLVDESTARFPWELLENRWGGQGRPFAVDVGVVRQLRTNSFREQPVYASANLALVIGNPLLGASERFSDLPGARQESIRVAAVLNQSDFEARVEIDKTAADILQALHGNGWRVVHLAGHGVHELEVSGDPSGSDAKVELADGSIIQRSPRKRLVSGMVIGDNVYLTPGDIEQMRYVPELVFVNCCYLGRSQRSSFSFNRLAANLGVQFIEMGVRAVVCAGWAVNDEAAAVFAGSFYESMLRGEPFSHAVQEARARTYEHDPKVNTWGAYQCYGDPGYRLVRSGVSARRRVWPNYVAPIELVRDLNSLSQEATLWQSTTAENKAWVKEWLDSVIADYIDHVPEVGRGVGKNSWLSRADVCAALGFVYGEARLFEEALEWLDRALRSTIGDCPIRVAEQYANFRIRMLADIWVALSRGIEVAEGETSIAARRQQIAEEIESAIYQLDVINARAPTIERLVLLGAACKRLAWIQQARPRVEALLNMAQYYRQALDVAGGDDVYAFSNWAIACLLLRRLDPGLAAGAWLGALAAMCERQSASTRTALEETEQIWLATGLADLQVVRLLMAADEATATPEELGRGAIQLYAAAFNRGASPRIVASVQEHLDFVLEITSDQDALWPKAVLDALTAVRSSI